MDAHIANLDWSGLEVLGPDECRELLAASPVGRLGFVDAGSPVILPVNFALHGSSIVFRTGTGSKLAAAVRDEPVCLEIDAWNAFDHSGWSVLAKGVASQVLDDDELAELDKLKVRPWSNPEARDSWVKVLVEELTGRRLR